jgi:DNA-binding NarL/FixJ family response regulator
MAQRLHTRSFRNYRDEHSPPLVALNGAAGNGVAESRIHRSEHLRLVTGSPDHESSERNGHEHSGPHRPATAETFIRVLIAAGHALVRAGYRTLLESDDRIEVVGEAADRPDTLALAMATEPDVVLLDLALPTLADPEAITAIISHPALAHAAVMLISPGESDERVFSALRAGAVGVLATDAEPAELIRAVRLLARGQALLPASAVRRLLGELAPHSRRQTATRHHIEELTDREREVVALAAEGLTNGEIAARLVISPATAKTHVSRAMIKLHARHRAQLVVSAYEHGLVLPTSRT